MYPQVFLQTQNQNFYHRQSHSVLNKQFESRKLSPATPIMVSLPQRRSQQFGRSNSPTHQHNFTAQKVVYQPESNQRLHTHTSATVIQGGYLQESLRITNKQPENPNLSNQQRISSFLSEKQQEKLSQTKTTSGESLEEEKIIKKQKSNSSYLQMQKSILDRDLQIIQIQRENNNLRENNKRLMQIEKDYDKILRENKLLRKKLELLERKVEHSPGRQSEYIQALSDIDKLKIDIILNQKH